MREVNTAGPGEVPRLVTDRMHRIITVSQAPPDLVTVPRAELEAIRDAMKDARAGLWLWWPHQGDPAKNCPEVKVLDAALAKLEAHLKGQP